MGCSFFSFLSMSSSASSYEYLGLSIGKQFVSSSCSPMDLPGSSVHRFSGKEYRWVDVLFIKEIFLTQDSNRMLHHCRQIFYHFEPQGSHIWGSRTTQKILTEAYGLIRLKLLEKQLIARRGLGPSFCAPEIRK